MSFKKWLNEYGKISKVDLENWWKENPNMKNLIPEDFDKDLLQHFIAYKNNQTNRWLAIATWVLAGATIVFSVLTLFYK